ncbi:MAG: DUF3857 domain-containing protein [Bryobacter sp.]|nr:DUF3857 domain-containing protein [Bryobacter sp.]
MLSRIILFHFIVITSQAGLNWKPVNPAELNLKAPKIDPKADAEAIFWEAWVEDTTQGGYAMHRQENYLRIKLFNARAVEKWGNVEVDYYPGEGMSISDFKGRVIKPDGTIVEVKGDQVKETTKQKQSKQTIRTKSFAFPALEPGVIIEYQYTKVYNERWLRYVKLPMQMEVPVWEINYFVKPAGRDLAGERMKAYPFNCEPTAWEPAKANGLRQGFVRTGTKNVPAFVEEPNMPSEDDTMGWLLVYYSPSEQQNPEKYWKSLGRKMEGEMNRPVKVSGEIKALAAEITAGKTSIGDKADAIAVYCQTKLKNAYYSANGVTLEERQQFFKKIKEDFDTNDALRLKMGRPKDILGIFYALSEAAGLHPTWMAVGSSLSAMFRPNFMDPYLLDNRMVGIPDNGELRFYNPGVPYIPPGMADYDEQGQAALVCDPKDPKLVLLPNSGPEFTVLRRKAKLALSDSGALSGNVELTHFGHFAVAEKRRLESLSPAEREEAVKKSLEERHPGIQIAKLTVENADVPMGVLTFRYDFTLEGFGQRTGKRIFFQPAFFNHNDAPRFANAERKYPVVFRNAFREEDEIEIALPEGFRLEEAEMPGNLQMGEVGKLSLTARVTKDDKEISVRRAFSWGSPTAGLFFEAKDYPAVKQAWDRIHEINQHQLTVRAQ